MFHYLFSFRRIISRIKERLHLKQYTKKRHPTFRHLVRFRTYWSCKLSKIPNDFLDFENFQLQQIYLISLRYCQNQKFCKKGQLNKKIIFSRDITIFLSPMISTVTIEQRTIRFKAKGERK